MLTKTKRLNCFDRLIVMAMTCFIMFTGGLYIQQKAQEAVERLTRSNPAQTYAIGLMLTGAKQRIIQCVR